MAEHTWLAKRALRMQNLCFSLQPKTPVQVKSGDIPVVIGFASQKRAQVEESRKQREKLKPGERSRSKPPPVGLHKAL